MGILVRFMVTQVSFITSMTVGFMVDISNEYMGFKPNLKWGDMV